MKKSTKITLVSLTTVAILAGIGGTLMVANDFNSRFEAFVKAKREQQVKEAEKKQREAKMTTKEKQVAYLKDHEQEIKDFVKSQNSKIESVQINWKDIRWSKGGNGTPQGGGEAVLIFGEFNNNPDSSWRVDVQIVDDKLDMENMYLGQDLRIGGRVFD
ncbi:hypothetical protein ACVR0S_09615 [Streptococcus dentapri]|uniref:Lipoprotein n=1 Tax=Streptococcus dentapri TaxID=573564 RepID=A0ABV8CYB9_9STRE